MLLYFTYFTSISCSWQHVMLHYMFCKGPYDPKCTRVMEVSCGSCDRGFWSSKMENAQTYIRRTTTWSQGAEGLSLTICLGLPTAWARGRVLFLIESANLNAELTLSSNWIFARICPNHLPLESRLSLQPSGMKLNREKNSIAFNQFNLKCETVADMTTMLLHWNAAQNCAQYKANHCAINAITW